MVLFRSAGSIGDSVCLPGNKTTFHRVLMLDIFQFVVGEKHGCSRGFLFSLQMFYYDGRIILKDGNESDFLKKRGSLRLEGLLRLKVGPLHCSVTCSSSHRSSRDQDFLTAGVITPDFRQSSTDGDDGEAISESEPWQQSFFVICSFCFFFSHMIFLKINNFIGHYSCSGAF